MVKVEVKMEKRKKALYWLGLPASLFVLIVISWMALETGIEISSRADIMSACTDCHVSHENLFAHFVGKAKSGTHDIWVELTTDTATHDWQSLRLKNEEYVYDSTQDKKVHNNYFDGVTDSKCVNCHEEVGHSNLNKYLLQNKYRSDG